MFRSVAAIALALGLCAAGSSARAGVYSDDLSKCLVKSASAEDQAELITWMFAALGRHPTITSYFQMTPAEMDAKTKAAALLFQRLLTVDCHAETVVALKYEGADTMTNAFEVLGQVAMRGLMSDPAVAKGFQDLSTYVDASKFEALNREAGGAKSP